MKKIIQSISLAIILISCTPEDVSPNYSGSYVSQSFCNSPNYEVTVQQVEGTTHTTFGLYTVEIIDGHFEGQMNGGIQHEGTFSDDGQTLTYSQTLSGVTCSAVFTKQ
jgi:hypothetical protein